MSPSNRPATPVARRSGLSGALAALLFCGAAATAEAQQRPAAGALPSADTGSIREPANMPRYAGSIIAGGSLAAFDEMPLVTSRLVRVPDRRDKRNNALFLPADGRKIDGKRTRLVYLIPEGRSPLEVIRGYQQLITERGGTKLYECSGDECGGDTRRGAVSGGGETGLLQIAIPADEAAGAPAGHPLNCAVDNGSRTGQRFTTLQLPNDGGAIAVLSYVLGEYVAGSPCRAGGWAGRTVAIVNIIETKAREQRMEMVKADAMKSSLEKDGKVTFYSILFDTARAEIKPESRPQIAEMAAFLKANPGLRVLIVGHTDNQGGLEYNIDLSKRRAASVTSALTASGIAAARMTPQGVGMAAPVSTNETDEGRSKNRRVEMVKF